MLQSEDFFMFNAFSTVHWKTMACLTTEAVSFDRLSYGKTHSCFCLVKSVDNILFLVVRLRFCFPFRTYIIELALLQGVRKFVDRVVVCHLLCILGPADKWKMIPFSSLLILHATRSCYCKTPSVSHDVTGMAWPRPRVSRIHGGRGAESVE